MSASLADGLILGGTLFGGWRNVEIELDLARAAVIVMHAWETGSALHSPGGMLDMSRRGFMCSAFRQAVTAVENRESARLEAHKESAPWRVAHAFGFVFGADRFVEVVDHEFYAALSSAAFDPKAG